MQVALENNIVFVVIEYLAILCWGLSGGLAAIRKGYDIFTIMLCGWLTALGGGLVRDVMLGALPSVGITDKGYVLTTLFSGIIVVVAHPEITKLKWTMTVIDALGLGLFAVSGTAKALAYGSSGMTAVFLGMFTALAGGLIRDIPAEEMRFSYRHSRLKDEPLVCLAVTMQLQHGDKAEILAKVADLSERRSSKQPLEMASAGSTFKRPVGHFAGPLIIDAGLQGYHIGGAQVSTKHAGFLVNTGDATADDVIRLIHTVQAAVLRKFGVRLETEVRFVGEWDDHPLYHEIMMVE